MKTIIAGSRECTDKGFVWTLINESGLEITEVVSGMARGVDLLGYEWGMTKGIPVEEFPVLKEDWHPDRHGKAAGHIRNKKMAESGAKQLLAIWDGRSAGTANMIKVAKERNLLVKVFRLDEMRWQVFQPKQEEFGTIEKYFV